MEQPKPHDDLFDDDGVSLVEVAREFRHHLVLLVVGPLLAGLAALGFAFTLAPSFTASTTFLPPQQQQSAAAAALAALGPLSALAGGGVKSSSDQYVSMMQSVTVTDRLIESFKLMAVYQTKFMEDARRQLTGQVRITIGKKDGFITVEVSDGSAQRAADIANAYVQELRRLTSGLALTEAQQRRAFFEHQLSQTRDRLAAAQQALQSSGFNVGALRAEPRSAADGYARLRAEVTAAEVRLQTLQRALAEGTPEVQEQRTLLAALRGQLAQLESTVGASGSGDYIGRYREFKYQETLFDLFARQYEVARLDESREGALIQVLDPATPPERRSSPKRTRIAVATTAIAFALLVVLVVLRLMVRRRGSAAGGHARSGAS